MGPFKENHLKNTTFGIFSKTGTYVHIVTLPIRTVQVRVPDT